MKRSFSSFMIIALLLTGCAQPEQGDVVVVNTPESGVMRGDRLVKRVVATAGQTIRID